MKPCIQYGRYVTFNATVMRIILEKLKEIYQQVGQDTTTQPTIHNQQDINIYVESLNGLFYAMIQPTNIFF